MEFQIVNRNEISSLTAKKRKISSIFSRILSFLIEQDIRDIELLGTQEFDNQTAWIVLELELEGGSCTEIGIGFCGDSFGIDPLIWKNIVRIGSYMHKGKNSVITEIRHFFNGTPVTQEAVRLISGQNHSRKCVLVFPEENLPQINFDQSSDTLPEEILPDSGKTISSTIVLGTISLTVAELVSLSPGMKLELTCQDKIAAKLDIGNNTWADVLIEWKMNHLELTIKNKETFTENRRIN